MLTRWLSTATGAMTGASTLLVAIAVVVDSLRWLAFVGAIGIAVGLAQVATHANRRVHSAERALARAQSRIDATELAQGDGDARLRQAQRDLDRQLREETQHRLRSEAEAAARTRELEQKVLSLSNMADAMLDRIRATEAGGKSLANQADATIDRIRAAEARANSLSNQADAMLDRIRATEKQTRTLDKATTSNRDAVERIEAATERWRDEEASTRSLAIAHNRPQPELRRVALLLTIHRSGSTRLFDMLRTHPGVRVPATMDVWRTLGLEGRRYPNAFSDTVDARVAIEVQPGRGALIPDLERAAVGEWTSDQWAVEKAHPQFFDFDVESFVTRAVAMQSSGIELMMTYQVRRPLDAMWSMVEFKRRQPTWYSWLETTEAPAWICRSLRVIAEVQERIPGHVVDFDDIPAGASLHRLGDALAPSWSAEETSAWLEHAARATDRSTRRQAEGAGFIGTPDPDRSPAGPDDEWIDLGDVLAEANEIYELVKSRV